MYPIIKLALWAIVVPSCALASWKWLRVAQREHYEPGRVSKISLIWLRARPINVMLTVGALTLLLVSAFYPLAAIPSAAVAAIIPIGLAVFAKETPLIVTGRVKRLLVALAILEGLLLSAAWVAPAPAAVAILMLLPMIVDVTLAATRPVEAAMANKFVADAQLRIRDVDPVVVAITGSYGKTSTKMYANNLISSSKRTLASPASFNNVLGLSKAVNDGLRPGIEVFIAEMGTYGPGEIRKLCQLFRPSIAAITTIGEAHLERMGNRSTIVRAKAEILEDVDTAVINVDVPELAQIADSLSSEKTVLRCSDTMLDGCDIAVIAAGDRWQIHLKGHLLAEIEAPATGHRINLAVAIAIASAVGIPNDRVVSALESGLGQASHRAEVAKTTDGTVVIDDTYNSNPEGATAAVRSARVLAGDSGTVWTISPGMIELGSNQRIRNMAFAQAATATPNMRLVVTGYTNRRDLLAGATDPNRVSVAKDRTAAQRLIQADISPGDVLLYENDLPSHYP